MGNQEITQAITEIKESVQLSKWQSEIEERQAIGLSVEAWCSRQGISKNTYYYRLRRVREHLCEIAGQLQKSNEAFQSVRLSEHHQKVRSRSVTETCRCRLPALYYRTC